MKTQVLIFSAAIVLTGCESRNPNYYRYGEYGYTYDLVQPPVAGLTDDVAKWANQTPTPKKPFQEERSPDPEIGVITFYQAPGTPPPPPPAYVAAAPRRPSISRQIQDQQFNPAYPPNGAGQYPYSQGGYNSGYAPNAYTPYAQPYSGYPYSYSYSDSAVFENNRNHRNRGGDFDDGGAGADNTGNGNLGTTANPPGQNRSNPSSPFNPVPNAPNSGEIQRFTTRPPGEPPGTELIPNRPFGQPPGTQLHDNYGVGSPTVTAPTTPATPNMNQMPQTGQLTPRTSPFDPALNPFVPGQSTTVQPMPPNQPGAQMPAIQQTPPAFPAQPSRQVQPVLPGAASIPRPAARPAAPVHPAGK